VDSLNNWSLKFVRWGMGLTVLGLITGYFPLGHYLMKDALPSCPTAPVHGHTILLSFVGMTMFGLAYRALPAWLNGADAPLKLVRLHFRLTTIGIIGVCLNGTIGYELLKLVQPEFYYAGPSGLAVRNLWFSIDGVFLTLYAAGCLVFLHIVMNKTTYSHAELTSERRAGIA
jgi:hypothetical protein